MPFWNMPPTNDEFFSNIDFVKPLTKDQIINSQIMNIPIVKGTVSINNRLDFARLALSEPDIFDKNEIYRLEQIIAGYDNNLPITDLQDKFFHPKSRSNIKNLKYKKTDEIKSTDDIIDENF